VLSGNHQKCKKLGSLVPPAETIIACSIRAVGEKLFVVCALGRFRVCDLKTKMGHGRDFTFVLVKNILCILDFINKMGLI
jgi:hypothetical protein